MLNNNKNIHLYIGYINDDQKDKFNLKNNKYVHLLNLSSHIEGEDINDINCHYSELCVAYYVWKHQLKSDYISIGQHRRYITPINFERLDNNEIQVFPILAHTDTLTPYKFMLKDGFNSYIILNFIKYLIKNNLASKEKIYDIIYTKNFETSYFNVFACNWNVFNNICEFIFGFMNDIMLNGNYDSLEDINEFNNDMRLSLNNNRFLINENELFGDFNYGRVNTSDRNIAAIFELLIPLYGKICYNVFYEQNNKKLGLTLLNFNKDTVLNDMFKWISKNTFSGTLNYYIKTKPENIEILQNIINENSYGLSSGIVIAVEEFPKDTIELNINEYIDVDDPTKSYTIDNIKTF